MYFHFPKWNLEVRMAEYRSYFLYLTLRILQKASISNWEMFMTHLTNLKQCARHCRSYYFAIMLMPTLLASYYCLWKGTEKPWLWSQFKCLKSISGMKFCVKSITSSMFNRLPPSHLATGNLRGEHYWVTYCKLKRQWENPQELSILCAEPFSCTTCIV